MKESFVTKTVDFDITIDGILVKVTNPDFTIYDVAKSVGINIPVPCFVITESLVDVRFVLLKLLKNTVMLAEKCLKKG